MLQTLWLLALGLVWLLTRPGRSELPRKAESAPAGPIPPVRPPTPIP